MMAAAQADADTFSMELADGVQFSDGGAAFFRYQPGRLEYHLGIWDGGNSNTAIGVGYPMTRGEKLKFRWIPDLALLQRGTDNLGTHGQFYNRFEFSYQKAQRAQLYLAWTHYSNGSRVFNHDREPNRGENFMTLGFRFALGRRRPGARDQRLRRHDIAQAGGSGKPSAQARPPQPLRDGIHLAQELSQHISGRHVEYGLSNWDWPDP